MHLRTLILENVMENFIKAVEAQIECWKLDAKLAWNRFQIFWYS